MTRFGIHKFSALIALAATVSTNAYGAAPTISGSLSLSISASTVCSLTTCVNTLKISESAQHTFELSESLTDAFTTETTVQFDSEGTSPWEFQLNDDPNYEAGDSLANIVNVTEAAGGKQTESAKLNWGGGKFSISVKRDISDKMESSAGPLAKLAETKVPASSENLNSIQSQIQTPGQSDVSVTAYLACDEKIALKVFESAEGELNVKTQISVKSKYVSDNVPDPD